MKRLLYRAVISAFITAIMLVSVAERSRAAVSGPPPAGLQTAIRNFMTLSSSDTITYGSYVEVNLCPTGKICLTTSYAYLVGYSIGDAGGSAVAIYSNTTQCQGCYTYTVLYAAGGPMDVATLESVGIDSTTAQALING